jgi:hypothetical protein
MDFLAITNETHGSGLNSHEAFSFKRVDQYGQVINLEIEFSKMNFDHLIISILCSIFAIA